MVNINDEFPSKYLKAADLQGHAVKLTIRDVVTEQINTDRKLIMYFNNRDKGMVLNKTNARTIGDVFGEDTDDWLGKAVEVFAMKVDFQGRMVDGLRVRVLPPPRQQVSGSANIAPNARARAEQQQTEYAGGGGAPLDDDIPFAPEWR
jgi:hypothetical protein